MALPLAASTVKKDTATNNQAPVWPNQQNATANNHGLIVYSSLPINRNPS